MLASNRWKGHSPVSVEGCVSSTHAFLYALEISKLLRSQWWNKSCTSCFCMRSSYTIISLQRKHCTVGTFFTIIFRSQAWVMASPLPSIAMVPACFHPFFFFFLFWWNKSWFFFFILWRGQLFGELLSYRKSRGSDCQVRTFKQCRPAHLIFLCFGEQSVHAWISQARSVFIQLFLLTCEEDFIWIGF